MIVIETERLVTTDQLANLLSVDRNTVCRLAEAGKIPKSEVGRCVRFDVLAVKTAMRRTIEPN